MHYVLIVFGEQWLGALQPKPTVCSANVSGEPCHSWSQEQKKWEVQEVHSPPNDFEAKFSFHLDIFSCLINSNVLFLVFNEPFQKWITKIHLILSYV